MKATWWNRFWYWVVLSLEIMRFAFFCPSWELRPAVMKGLFVFFSLGNQKHHLSVDGNVLKAEHWLLSCHISSLSVVVLPSASLLSWEVLAALFFPCRQFSKGKSNVQPLWYRHSWNALLHYLSKYILVLSIILVGTALGFIFVMEPNLLQQISEMVLGPFDLFWPA